MDFVHCTNQFTFIQNYNAFKEWSTTYKTRYITNHSILDTLFFKTHLISTNWVYIHVCRLDKASEKERNPLNMFKTSYFLTVMYRYFFVFALVSVLFGFPCRLRLLGLESIMPTVYFCVPFFRCKSEMVSKSNYPLSKVKQTQTSCFSRKKRPLPGTHHADVQKMLKQQLFFPKSDQSRSVFRWIKSHTPN